MVSEVIRDLARSLHRMPRLKCKRGRETKLVVIMNFIKV